ncbi:hypothetical protein [Micromonospora haikouensis]|uniref:hypothetical protein n=1 Tax=Micromonospora haikouensis TaxID=686309 RepID=UPI003D758D8F
MIGGWLVVGVDGTLTHHTTTPTSSMVREAVGDGTDRVGLPLGLAGWVDGDGHPKRLSINVVGSVLLMALGAGHMPYAGPVVITGWDPDREVVPLPSGADIYVRAVHHRVQAALAGAVDDDGFADAVRETAEELRRAQRPTLTVVTLGGEDR